MMRAPTAWSVAVRQPDGDVVARRDDLDRLAERNRWARIPFIRGIFVLGESLSLGYKALSWSAQMATGEEEKPLTGAQIGWTMALAFAFFAGIFILLPAFAAGFVSDDGFVFNLVEGLIRLSLFVGYIWAIGRSAEIARVFEYHGAEHMSIHAFEAGEPLSVESVARYRPEHPRCGTSFLLIVVLGSIVFFTFFGVPDGILFLVVSRLLGIPIIAGFSYELLRWSGLRPDGRLAAALAAPGIWLQKLTTKVPDGEQIEVAISSLVCALDQETAEEVISRGGVPSTAIAARASVIEAA